MKIYTVVVIMNRTDWFLKLIDSNKSSLDCFLLYTWKKYEPYIINSSRYDDVDKKPTYQLSLRYSNLSNQLSSNLLNHSDIPTIDVNVIKNNKNSVREKDKILIKDKLEVVEKSVLAEIESLFNDSTNNSSLVNNINVALSKKEEDGSYTTYFYLLLLDSLNVLHIQIKDFSKKYLNNPQYTKEIVIYNTTSFYDQKTLSEIEKDYFGNSFQHIKNNSGYISFQPKNLHNLSSAWKNTLLDQALKKDNIVMKEIVKV